MPPPEVRWAGVARLTEHGSALGEANDVDSLRSVRRSDVQQHTAAPATVVVPPAHARARTRMPSAVQPREWHGLSNEMVDAASLNMPASSPSPPMRRRRRKQARKQNTAKSVVVFIGIRAKHNETTCFISWVSMQSQTFRMYMMHTRTHTHISVLKSRFVCAMCSVKKV